MKLYRSRMNPGELQRYFGVSTNLKLSDAASTNKRSVAHQEIPVPPDSKPVVDYTQPLAARFEGFERAIVSLATQASASESCEGAFMDWKELWQDMKAGKLIRSMKYARSQTFVDIPGERAHHTRRTSVVKHIESN